MTERGRAPAAKEDPESAESFLAAAEALKASSVPAVVLEVPTERIVAASPSGAMLLDPAGGAVVDRNFEDFTSDVPSGVLDLFADGRVTGYEATRLLRRPDETSTPVSVWLHKFDHQPASWFALAVLTPPRPAADPEAFRESAVAIVGTADAAMQIDRISNDTLALFGRPRTALLGRPLTDLVNERDRSGLLEAVAEAASLTAAVAFYVRPASSSDDTDDAGTLSACEILILPMDPAPNCAFVVLEVQDAQVSPGPVSAPSVSGLLSRLRRGAQVAGLARDLLGVRGQEVPGFEELTTREWEVVVRLLEGSRVPAIATELFLSQSTVRSHLAQVFSKLGINSQQQLVDLLGKSYRRTL